VDRLRAKSTTAELSLEEAIRLAFEANPDLRAASERTQIAEATLARARAEFYPTLALNQEYQASDNPLQVFSFLQESGRGNELFPSSISIPIPSGGLPPVLTVSGLGFKTPSTEDVFHTQMRIEQQLYSGGLRLARTRSATADLDASRFGLAAFQNRLVFQVAEAYYHLFQTRELVKVRREAVTQVEYQLKMVEARLRAGKAVQSDVLQVQVRLAEVREALITARNQEALGLAILENVVGLSLSGRRLPEVLPEAPWSTHLREAEAALSQVANGGAHAEEVEAAVSEAVRRRPEVGEANSQRQAAEYRIRAAQAGNYPTLGVVTDYDLYTTDFRKEENSFFVGLVFSLKLWDAGRTRASVRQAEAQVREIAARNQRLVLDIELEVRRAYLQVKDAHERSNVTVTAVALASERLRQVEVQYSNQAATVTQLIDAQVALSDARVRYTNAQAEIEIARATLERAIGRLSGFLNPSDARRW
jgi:outer membrane protein TolC